MKRVYHLGSNCDGDMQSITKVIKDASSSPTSSNNLPPSFNARPVVANARPVADSMPQSVVKILAFITMVVLQLKNSAD